MSKMNINTFNGTYNDNSIDLSGVKELNIDNRVDNRNYGNINNGTIGTIMNNDYTGANIVINTKAKSNIGSKVKDTVKRMTQKDIKHRYYSLVSKQGKALLLEFNGIIEKQTGNVDTASLQLLYRLMEQAMTTKDKLTIVLWKNLYSLINNDVDSFKTDYNKQLAVKILEMKKKMKDRIEFKTNDVCKGTTEYIVKDLAWKNI